MTAASNMGNYDGFKPCIKMTALGVIATMTAAGVISI